MSFIPGNQSRRNNGNGISIHWCRATKQQTLQNGFFKALKTAFFNIAKVVLATTSCFALNCPSSVMKLSARTLNCRLQVVENCCIAVRRIFGRNWAYQGQNLTSFPGVLKTTTHVQNAQTRQWCLLFSPRASISKGTLCSVDGILPGSSDGFHEGKSQFRRHFRIPDDLSHPL